MSVVPSSKISSPPSNEIKAGSTCTVKGFESCPSWLVSVGTKEEVERMEEFIKNKTAAEPKRLLTLHRLKGLEKMTIN